MTAQAYLAIIVVLFIILILGWSTTLFGFLAGIGAGIIGIRMYDSEILINLATVGMGETELVVSGVYSSQPVTLIEKSGKQLKIRNEPNIPRENDVPEYPTGVVIPCYERSIVNGVPLEIVLTRKMKSDKNMLISRGSLKNKYYLELAPQYTKRDANQSIIGVYALKTESSEKDAISKSDTLQKSEKHTSLLELLAKLLNRVWCGKTPEGVKFLGASKHSSAIPDQGPIALISHVEAKMHTLSGADFLQSADKNRGNVDITYDDETISIPVIEKGKPGKNELSTMPLFNKIEDMAESCKLLVVIQDYITSAIAGDALPRNVIYIGQSLRDDPAKKLYLNAFINPKAYDSILRLLNGITP